MLLLILFSFPTLPFPQCGVTEYGAEPDAGKLELLTWVLGKLSITPSFHSICKQTNKKTKIKEIKTIKYKGQEYLTLQLSNTVIIEQPPSEHIKCAN